jgi:hypothetical protein
MLNPSDEGYGVNLRVRLIRKLAERVNGVDLSKVHVGDSLDLPSKDARLLIAEGWAELVEPPLKEVAAHHVIGRESK